MRTVVTLLLITVVLVSVGCETTNSHLDQEVSFLGVDAQVYSEPIWFPEIEVSGLGLRAYAARDYLRAHSAFLLSGDALTKEIIENGSIVDFSVSKHGFNLRSSVSIEVSDPRSAPVAGSCFPISPDGYFLTSAHLVESPQVFVQYVTSNKDYSFPTLSKGRIVFVNKESDLALVKAEINTPRYLELGKGSPKVGERVFGGGWMHRQAAGRCLGVRVEAIEIEGQMVWCHWTESDLPLIGGDSGSPLVDKNGRLCGVNTSIRIGRFVIHDPKAMSVVLDPEFMNTVISADRDRGESR